MTDTSSNNKRIAKNTMFLYIRMLFLMFLSFFTSRILLRELGVEDYGIYNVVGSVVAIFGSLKGFLTSSTQRFLNYEKGIGSLNKLRSIFSMSMYIHIIIGLLFLFLVTPIGVIVIKHYLVIPPERMTSALIVFILSILSVIVSLLTVPYDSVIIANEKMNIFAYLSILDGFLRLLVVLLLQYTFFDHLIFYGSSLLLVSFIVRLISSIYCRKNFEECHLEFKWDNHLFKKMGGFAGWQLLGNTSISLQSQGLNMILNVFFGPILNAARGIANQASGVLNLFIYNMMLAVNPQLTKLYAQNRRRDFLCLFFNSSRYSIMIFFIVAFPVFLNTDEYLSLWLVSPPSDSVIFLKLMIIYTTLRVLHEPLDSIIKATGDIRRYQIFDSLTLLIALPITYYLYSKGYSAYYMYISMYVSEIFNLLVTLVIANKKIEFGIFRYLNAILKLYIILIIIFFLFVQMSRYFNFNNWFFNNIIYSLAYFFTVVFITLSGDERRDMLRLILKKI